MTTIAWDGKTLAGDTQATSGCVRRRVETKVHRIQSADGNVYLLGCSGMDQDMHVVLDWLRKGMRDEDRPKFDPDSFSAILVPPPHHRIVWRLESRCIPLPIKDPFHALGNGREFAMAAMYLGKSAREAILVAHRFDVDTGNEVVELAVCE